MVIYGISEDAQVINIDLFRTLEDYLSTHIQTMSFEDFLEISRNLSRMRDMLHESFDKGEVIHD